VPEAGVIIGVQILCGTAPLKFGTAKTSKIRRDFRQLQTWFANVSGTDQDIGKRKTALSTTISPTFDKKNGGLWSTTHSVYASNFYPSNNEHCVG